MTMSAEAQTSPQRPAPDRMARRGNGRLAGYYVLLAILVLGFVMRLWLGNWRSYWYDEFLSVIIYGIDHDSAFEAVRFLAERSIHPPLYQFLLYIWMDLFGTAEVATRSLSNLYVTGATACIYLLVADVWNRRAAFAAAIVFTLMYIPTMYGMETRSYGQTIFLSALSSLMLFKVMRSLPVDPGMGRVLRDWRVYALILANYGLLMTHYYNVLFLGAQGLFLSLFYLIEKSRTSPIRRLIELAFIGIAPLVLLLVSWGQVMLYSYSSRTERYVAETVSRDPFEMFVSMVWNVNIVHSREAIGIGFAIVVGVLVLWALFRIARHLRRNDTHEAYLVVYCVFWMLMPFVLAYVLFFLAGHERYSSRYFVFVSAPIAVLFALGIDNLARMLARIVPSGPRPTLQRWSAALSAPLTIALALPLVGPGGFSAASRIGEDYRGIAASVASIASRAPEHDYLLYEAGGRTFLDFYLDRQRGNLRVARNITRANERNDAFSFADDVADLGPDDRIIVGFTHDRANNYPNALAELRLQFEELVRVLNNTSRGFIVYRIGEGAGDATQEATDDDAGPPPEPDELPEDEEEEA